jgi:L-rhamnose isomerase
MSKLVAIATNKGLQKAFPNTPILSQSIYNSNRLSLSIPRNESQKKNSLIGSLPVEQSVKLDAAINSTATASSSNSKVQDWTVEEVIKWVNSLKLSVSYDTEIQSNALDGNSLCSIEGDDDIKEIWTDLGMTKVGDKLKLKRAIKILISTQNI